jgi:Sulfotransferase domain
MNTRVSVFCCGVQKGGTTSLHAYLREHPDLQAPRIKETHFFDNEDYDWNAPNYMDLDAFYPVGGSGTRFDVTPIYTFWPPSLSRIQAYNPNSRLIFLFRDPFERAWSHWCMEFARDAETLPFAAAIRKGRRRLDGLPLLAPERRIYSYVERGQYADQVRRAQQHFPSESLLFLRSEDLLHHRFATLERIASFLDISPFADAGEKHENTRARVVYPSTPTEEDRALFAEELRDDLIEFSSLTGFDISGWSTLR